MINHDQYQNSDDQTTVIGLLTSVNFLLLQLVVMLSAERKRKDPRPGEVIGI
jgi:hypothetical protein